MAAAESAGFPLGELPCVAARVDPEPELLFEWEAFRELKTDRPVGLDVGAIPFTAIDRFAVRHGLEGEEFDRFVRMIRALDHAERSYHRDHKPVSGGG